MYFYADRFPVKSFLAVPTGKNVLETPLEAEDGTSKCEGDFQSRRANSKLNVNVRAAEDGGRASSRTDEAASEFMSVQSVSKRIRVFYKRMIKILNNVMYSGGGLHINNM
jgi:hypothetical protein